MTHPAPLRFPENFHWGAATAAHQVEGNNINNDWWAREHTAGSGIAEPSGDACDSYHRYREDMALLADAGLNTYRFSLEWSRIEPEAGFVSRAAIDHYRRMVAACHEFGLTPMVTLHHFTVPRWMDAMGGWRHPDAADLFGRFTEIALPIVADGVEWVCTINEPNIMSMIHGRRETDLVASGLPAPDEAISEVLRQAHVRSRKVLGSVPALRTGWSVATQAFHPEPGCEQAARDYGYPREDLLPRGCPRRRLGGRAGLHPNLHRARRPAADCRGDRDHADRLGVFPAGARHRRPERVGADRRGADLRHRERHRHGGRQPDGSTTPAAR